MSCDSFFARTRLQPRFCFEGARLQPCRHSLLVSRALAPEVEHQVQIRDAQKNTDNPEESNSNVFSPDCHRYKQHAFGSRKHLECDGLRNLSAKLQDWY